MPVQVLDTTDGIFTIRVSGTMTPADLRRIEAAAAESIRANEEGRFLIIASDFTGWAGDNWDDMSFRLHFDRHIRKIAVVCEPAWTDRVMLFMGQGLRRIAIEHFLPSQLDQARSWLGEQAAQSAQQ